MASLTLLYPVCVSVAGASAVSVDAHHLLYAIDLLEPVHDEFDITTVVDAKLYRRVARNIRHVGSCLMKRGLVSIVTSRQRWWRHDGRWFRDGREGLPNLVGASAEGGSLKILRARVIKKAISCVNSQIFYIFAT